MLAAQAARDAASTSTTWPVPRQPRTDVAADRQGEANAFAPPDDAPQRATVTGGQVVVMSDSDESDGDDVRAELAAAPAVRASSAAGSAPGADSADVRTESLAAGAGHGDVGGATAVGPGGSAGFSRPFRSSDPPTIESDRAILAAMIESSAPGDPEVARQQLLSEGIIDATFTAEEVDKRFRELCEQAQQLERG